MKSETSSVYSFKNSEMWKRARTIGIDAYRLGKNFPKDDTTRVVTRQFVASATSIAANVAEGHGRFSRAAYRNHLSIARGSAAETENWLDFFREVGLIDAKTEADLATRYRQFIAAATVTMRSLSAAGTRSTSLREPSTEYVTGGEHLDLTDLPDDLDDDALMLDAPMLQGDEDDFEA